MEADVVPIHAQDDTFCQQVFALQADSIVMLVGELPLVRSWLLRVQSMLQAFATRCSQAVLLQTEHAQAVLLKTEHAPAVLLQTERV